MRNFLNGILSFIGSESLTDIEFDSLTITEQSYTIEAYEALKAVLQEREGVSGQLQKLHSYFTARGVSLSTTTGVALGQSQILIGGALD